MSTTDLTTYQAVVLQSRAHRAIKTNLSQALRAHGITMMQWSIVGLVADAGKEGARISDLAHALDTSLAFVTTSINVLEAKGYVSRTGHILDNRSKVVRLSEDFAPKVAIIESDLYKQLNERLYAGIKQRDLDAYLKTLQKIAQTI